MDYELTLMQEPSYLHVTGAGKHTAENMRRFLIDAHQAAVERNCDSLLLEMNFRGLTIGLGAIYSIISERSPYGARFKRIAYVDVNTAHAPEPIEFAEMAANRLGVNVRLFRTLTEAKVWLQHSDHVSSSTGHTSFGAT